MTTKLPPKYSLYACFISTSPQPKCEDVDSMGKNDNSPVFTGIQYNIIVLTQLDSVI